MKIAALYARVSGEQQRDSNTIASQTEALLAYAERHGYRVAPGMVIEDDGFTGAVLERPGLERVRDLAAEGRIEAVLVHAPDRLSRRYAYQVLIIEELARHGVETVFLKAPSMETPEDHLLVQFQGMIAEYERAQILERSRRGKRHRARRGEVAVLGGAPYGYRYHKKTQDSDAFYEIAEPQASVVRNVYRDYTEDHMSIGAIAPHAQRTRDPHVLRAFALGTLGGVGDAAQPGLQGKGVLRQDPGCAAPQRAASASPRRVHRQQYARSRAAAGRLDRDPGAGDRQRRDLRSRRRAVATEQGLLQAQDQDAQRLAGARGVRQVRLRAVPHVGPNQCPQDLLLPLPGFRRLAPSQRPRCATAAQCARICSTTSCGPNWSACSKIPHW